MSDSILRVLPIFILFLLITEVGFSQRSQNQSRSDDPTRLQVIDEIGLRIALENIEQDGVIDKSTYQVGVNDIFTVEVSGNVSFYFRGLAVNPTGDVVIPEISTVSVAGLILPEAKEKISEAVKRRFIGSTVRVSLDLARPVGVHLTGSVPVPGRTTLPVGTRVDQLVSIGIFPELLVPAPPISDPDGQIQARISKSSRLLDTDLDLRNIKISRADGTVIFADLIAYNLGGMIDYNPSLMDGDIIHVRKRSTDEAMVSISGAVGNPVELPLAFGDTAGRLINIGGMSGSANKTDSLMVVRFDDGRFHNIRLTRDDAEAFPLQAGDRVIIPTDPLSRRMKSVRLFGEINAPGTYPIISGETSLFEVLKLSGGLTDKAHPNLVTIRRGSTERELRMGLSPLETERRSDVRIPVIDIGMLRTSDQFETDLEFLREQINFGNWSVYADLENESELQRIRLFGGDEIRVHKNENTVYMMGQVQKPGFHTFSGSGNAMEYIEKAGGFSVAADMERVFVVRAGTNSWYRYDETDVRPGDIIYVDRLPIEDYQVAVGLSIQQQQLRNNNIQILLSTVATIASVVTTYLIITRD